MRVETVGQAVTIIISTPPTRSELEQIVLSLLQNTPQDAFDLVLVMRDATSEVKGFVELLEGDVRIFENVDLRDVILKLNESGAAAPNLVIPATTHRFSPNWIQVIEQIDEPVQVVFAGQLAVIRTGAEIEVAHLSRALNSLFSPPVLQSLGTQFRQDMETLLIADQRGDGYVGNLPIDVSERIRERMAMEEERRLLLIARNGQDVCWPPEAENEPLVTVRIPTYNRGRTVINTAIHAARAQTYEHIEILVVGDGSDEEAVSALSSVRDERVRFINLPVRGTYPEDPWLRWLVAGVPPVNFATQLARGTWIAPCDDDDEFTEDHIETLLTEALERRLEMVWSKAEMQTPDGWEVVGGEPLGPGNVSHGTVLYSSGLRFLQLSNTCWKLNEPADGNFWRRMSAIGVRTGFIDRVTYRHYLEGRYRMNVHGPAQMK